LLDGISNYIKKIEEFYGEEFFNMYTKEDFFRDYPPTDEFVPFPWDKERYEKTVNKAYEDGKEDGKEEGVKQNSIELATKMLSEGLAIPLIAKITGLSESEINALKPES
jgi:predicted transposase/invertase (TIGR01784 family)